MNFEAQTIFKQIELGNTEQAVSYIKNTDLQTLNQTDLSGWSMLHIASLLGEYEVIEVLIDKGVDVNTKTDNGYTAIDILFLAKHKLIQINNIETQPIVVKKRYSKLKWHR